MRKKDREVADFHEMLGILNKCSVVRLGLNATDYPYVVPMNFGFDSPGDSITIWLHCAPEGMKLDLIKLNPRVGFEADCSHRLIVGEKACKSTMEYESVMGFGNIAICNDSASKVRGLQAIMRHYAPDRDFGMFSESELSAVCVLRLDVVNITAKRLIKLVK